MATKYLNLNLDTSLGGQDSSDTTISSQKAIKTYVDTTIAGTSYTTTNPVLTPVAGVVEWTITHNLGTTNVISTIYYGDDAVWVNVKATTDNTVTVTLNSNSSIPADTYTAVIVTSGGITASGGGGSIVVDDTLSSTSTNPVQNKVLYPSLSGFIPNGTIIKVGSGSGNDFAKLSDAFNYIAHKWSNGTVTIQLGAETITETEAISSFPECNFPHLLIKGAGVTQTIIECVGRATGGFINSIQTNCDTKFQDICFKNTDTSVSSAAICAYNGGNFNVTNCKSIDFIRGLILTQQGGSFYCGGTLTIENTTATNMQAGVWSNAGNIYFPNGTILKVTNATYGFLMGAGGFVRSNGLIFNINTVTNRYNITRNTVQESGMIIGPITEGTY